MRTLCAGDHRMSPLLNSDPVEPDTGVKGPVQLRKEEGQ